MRQQVSLLLLMTGCTIGEGHSGPCGITATVFGDVEEDVSADCGLSSQSGGRYAYRFGTPEAAKMQVSLDDRTPLGESDVAITVVYWGVLDGSMVEVSFVDCPAGVTLSDAPFLPDIRGTADCSAIAGTVEPAEDGGGTGGDVPQEATVSLSSVEFTYR